MPNKDFQPNWASMPGDTISEVLKTKKISLSLFAEKMESSIDTVRNLLHGYISINEEVARKLEHALGSSAQFWIKRENQYRESITRLKNQEEQKWIKEIPVSDLIGLRWIKESENIVEECLNFFGVPDVWTWRKKYSDVTTYAAFRKSSAIKSNPAAIAAWLREAELKASSIKCKNWDIQMFKTRLSVFRNLMRKKDPKIFVPELQNLCAECGVALVILKTPAGCPVSGATKFLNPHKALIVLSFRYRSDDHFWFTFFHEAGHLILHNYREAFIDTEDDAETKEEKEANEFAELTLIPKQFQTRLRSMSPNQHEVKNLSKDADVPLGIVVGQLQHLNRLNKKYLNGFKRRYDMSDIYEVSQ
jgi:plasmid maintenance system antidote protein VapI